MTEFELPKKKGESSVLHVRVPKKELKALKKAGVDVPEIVRQAIRRAAKVAEYLP